MLATFVPRKLLWVSGLAVSVSGSGETSTEVPGSVASCSSVAGRHEGEGLLRAEGSRELDRTPVASTTATPMHAATALSTTMRPILVMRSPRFDGLSSGGPRG